MKRYNYSPDHIPSISFVPFVPSASSDNKEIRGPLQADSGVREESTDGSVCAETISTYPSGSLGDKVMCDVFAYKSLGNRSIVSLCDGCGWGTGSRNAAMSASKVFLLPRDDVLTPKAFVDYFSRKQLQFVTLTSATIKDSLLAALHAAHNAIINSA